MMSKIPTLTPDGFIENDNLKLNKLYEYFITSEYSQTFFYVGHVSSLKYLLGEYPIHDDPEDLASAIKQTLEAMYARYFDTVTVSCTVTEELVNSNIFNIKLNIEVVNNDIANSLYRSVHITNSKIDFLKTTNILLYKKEL